MWLLFFSTGTAEVWGGNWASFPNHIVVIRQCGRYHPRNLICIGEGSKGTSWQGGRHSLFQHSDSLWNFPSQLSHNTRTWFTQWNWFIVGWGHISGIPPPKNPVHLCYLLLWDGTIPTSPFGFEEGLAHSLWTIQIYHILQLLCSKIFYHSMFI